MSISNESSFFVVWLLIDVSYKRHRQVSSESVFVVWKLAPRFFRVSRRGSNEQGSVVPPRDRRECEPQRRDAEKDQARGCLGLYGQVNKRIRWMPRR